MKYKFGEEYRKIHNGENFIRNGEIINSKTFYPFDGKGVWELVEILPEYVKKHGGNILDYGSGSGRHWTDPVLKSRKNLCEILGKSLVGFRRYDPYYEPYSERPDGTYNIVVCSDVLEHIPLDELPTLLKDIESYLKKDGIILFKISTIISRNSFIDGTNLHVTLMKKEEWEKYLKEHLTSQFFAVYE